MNSRYGYKYGYRGGSVRAAGGGPLTITSSDGDTASLINNGDGTYGVVIGGSTVGTITQAQINGGGWITVVSPVTGMSGSNVVLTTVGHVIYVGDVDIETDVEVLADTAIVGNALPFDATAYPAAALTVRFKYSIGADSITINTTARLAPLKLIQFRNSHMNLGIAASGSTAPWPTSLQTRRMTLALRIVGNFNNDATIANNVGRVSMTGVGIRNNRFAGGGLNGEIDSTSPSPQAGFGAFSSWSSGASQSISFLAAVDYDGGLPGGEKFVVWWSRNGGAWARLGGHTTGPGDARNVWMTSFGAQDAVQTGGSFDIHNHLWAANVALDPATNWSNFFNADGTVKALGPTGVIAGVTPVVYMVGNDFVTGSNRGSGGGIAERNRTPVTVINL